MGRRQDVESIYVLRKLMTKYLAISLLHVEEESHSGYDIVAVLVFSGGPSSDVHGGRYHWKSKSLHAPLYEYFILGEH